MTEHTKLQRTHLSRQAWVYVRQSTMTQVREHTESLEAQYELAERAEQLGWKPEQIRVVDEDLGRSGAEASARSGFQSLVAAVGLGQVGLVIGKEVSRLARRNSDWYHLLDLCALTDTLIADTDGLYHPGDYNDRLVLGLKGTMSEAELHLLRSRLDAGLRHKAAKGELRQGLPVGLDYDADDRVILAHDEAVREAIATVFRRFDELGSGRQVLLSMRADGLLLPRRSAGEKRIRWAEATYPAIHDFLTNPAYAGAFVFGRNKLHRFVDETGTVVTSHREMPLEEWDVCIPDHHPGYVDWDTYLATRARLRANWRAPVGEAGGALREGPALLQGLVRCGRCGRKMMIGYSGVGSQHRYACVQGLRLYGSASTCQSVGGRHVDVAVVEKVSSFSSLPRWPQRQRRSLKPRPTITSACVPSSSASSEHDSRPSGRGASSTPSSLRIAWWPAASSGSGNNGSQCCGRLRLISQDNVPGAHRRSVLTKSHGCRRRELICMPSSTRPQPRCENANNCCVPSSLRSSSRWSARRVVRTVASSGKVAPRRSSPSGCPVVGRTTRATPRRKLLKSLRASPLITLMRRSRGFLRDKRDRLRQAFRSRRSASLMCG